MPTPKNFQGAHLIKVPSQGASFRLKMVKALLKIPIKKRLHTPQNTFKGRKSWEDFASLMSLAPDIKCVPLPHFPIAAEWFLPILTPACSMMPVILYLHGGGYCMGSIKTHRSFLTHLSHITQTRVFAINYRLAPEHPFPAALEDALHAYKWVLAENPHYPIFIAGDSAGGGLALSLLLALKNEDTALPTGVICFSPWADLAHQGESYHTLKQKDLLLHAPALPPVASMYTGNNNPYNPLISPVYGDFHGLPPLFIQVGSEEILLSDTLRVFEKVKAGGGSITLEIWEGQFHVWPYLACFLPEGKKALRHVKSFIDAWKK